MELSLYGWEARAEFGVVVAAEIANGGDERGFGDLAKVPAPYHLHAKPLRRGLPSYSIRIEPGCEPIFEHVAFQRMGGIRREGCIVGRRWPDGREDVLLALWTGEHGKFASVAEARALFAGSAKAP